MGETIGGVLREAARTAPDEVVLLWAGEGGGGRRRLTAGDLVDESERAAAALLQRFDPGEHVAVWAPSRPEWLVLLYGAALAGLVLVPVNPALRPRELLHVLGQSRSAGIFLAPEHRGNRLPELLAEVRPRLPGLREVIDLAAWDRFTAGLRADVRLPAVRPDDTAQIQYTSGTTGQPRGAMLTHRGLVHASRSVARALAVQPGETWLNPNPLFHTSGSGFMNLGPLQAGARQVLCPFQPSLVLELIERERPAVLGAAATMVRILLDHPELGGRDTSSLRAVAAGGMPVPADLVRGAEAVLGAPLLVGYGQTEASGLTHLVRPDDPPEVRTGTVGRPLPGVEVRIVDPGTGAALPPGVVGEVLVRGEQVMAGYLELPEATAATIDPDGWLNTGDAGSADASGHLRIAGRTREIIIRGGENVYPAEVEEVLSAHPAVAAVAVLGLPHPVHGEQVVAVVQAAPGARPAEAELAAYCRSLLAPFKVPVRWELVEELPRTPIGKVRKHELRARLEG